MGEAKVLIVDDDDVIRTLLHRILQDESYTLLQAHGGQEALEIIEQERPDLVLLDVMMPHLDGLTVLKAIKSKEQTRDIVVIMVTALGEDEQVSDFLEAGASDHIVKPFSKVIVRARVKAALRNRPASARPPGKVIGFLGTKGGAGTTTVASNVAVALQNAGHASAVLDFRSWMGAVAHQFGVNSSTNIQSLLEPQQPDAINAGSLDRCVITHVSGVKLLLAPPTMTAEHNIEPEQAVAILDAASHLADYLIVDLPNTPSPTLATALQHCHFVALTVPVETLGVVGAQKLLETFAGWDVASSQVGAVLVVHHASMVSSVSVGYARERLSCRVVGVIPPARDHCLTGFEKGVPLVLAMPKCPEALAFTELAKRLTQDPVQGMPF